MFNPNDLVKIKPEFTNHDPNILFFVTEWNGDRGFISLANWDQGDIRPSELVRDYMIELASPDEYICHHEQKPDY